MKSVGERGFVGPLTLAVCCALLVGVASCGEQEAEREANYGMHAALTGQPESAIRAINRAIATDPKNAGPGAYDARAIAYQQIDDPQAALPDLDEALRIARSGQPNFRIVHLYQERGEIYSSLGEYDRAIQDANSALSLREGMLADCQAMAKDVAQCTQNSEGMIGLSYGLRGYAQGALGHYDLALKDQQEAMRLAPGDQEIYYYQGLAYRSLGQSQRADESFKASVARFDQLIASDKAPASVYSCQQGVVLFAFRKDQQAEQAFDRCYASLNKAGSPQMIPRYERMAKLAGSHPTWGPTYW